MSTPPKAEIVKRFREATGMGWIASKLFLAGKSAELCARILRAQQEQTGPTLHDPIEDDEAFKAYVQAAKESAEENHRMWIAERNAQLRQSGRENEIKEWPLGSCHRIWKVMKDELQQKGIVWYSLAEMNPGHHFD